MNNLAPIPCERADEIEGRGSVLQIEGDDVLRWGKRTYGEQTRRSELLGHGDQSGSGSLTRLSLALVNLGELHEAYEARKSVNAD
jgi:hypothetical protein